MPLIYNSVQTKKYDVSFIPHYKDKGLDTKSLHTISVETDDYKYFIDEILSSKLIISSSLHGIILSEAYGIPCIWLKTRLDDFKFYDYYYSTNRMKIVSCTSLNDCLKTKPMNLPKNIDLLRRNLIDCFPYDLWE